MSFEGEKFRVSLLDFLRGCLIFMMVVYHFFWDLGYFGYINFSYVINGIGLLIAQFIGASFIFLSGISIPILFSLNSFNGYVFLFKFMKIFSISAIISFTTWLIDPSSFIYFGILHLLSLCYILAYITTRIRGNFFLYIILGTLCLIWALELKLNISTSWSWTGITREIAASNDFYPIIPWGIFFFTGFVCSNYILRQIKALKIDNSMDDSDQSTLILKIIIWAGKKSLLIYIFHQPLFFSLFLSFNTLRSY